jgi:tetratricopeptide (TPR) repeat protein
MRRANLLYEAKAYEAAVEAMNEALAGREEPMLLYNLACFESLAGKRDDALGHLRRAVELDVSYRALAHSDTDFDPIRADISEL